MLKKRTVLFLPAISAFITLLGHSHAKPPTRAFDAPGAPEFRRLDDQPGTNPPVTKDGNYLIGPTYVPAPEQQVNLRAARKNNSIHNGFS